MMTEPRGPVYLCYDAWLQEAPLEEKVTLPKSTAPKVPSKLAPDQKTLEEIGDRILAADWPVLMPQYVGRVASGFDDMVALDDGPSRELYDVGYHIVAAIGIDGLREMQALGDTSPRAFMERAKLGAYSKD